MRQLGISEGLLEVPREKGCSSLAQDGTRRQTNHELHATAHLSPKCCRESVVMHRSSWHTWFLSLLSFFAPNGPRSSPTLSLRIQPPGIATTISTARTCSVLRRSTSSPPLLSRRASPGFASAAVAVLHHRTRGASLRQTHGQHRQLDLGRKTGHPRQQHEYRAAYASKRYRAEQLAD